MGGAVRGLLQRSAGWIETVYPTYFFHLVFFFILDHFGHVRELRGVEMGPTGTLTLLVTYAKLPLKLPFAQTLFSN